MDDSCIKLFLSVDIAGSTKLKNTNNYYQIQHFCEEHVTIEKILEPNSHFTSEKIYEKICEDEAHQDWSRIIQKCFDDFNTRFNGQLDLKTSSNLIFPWKMAGDELIYCIDVDTRTEVYKYLFAFFKTLRFFDKLYLEKGSYIRLKGSAWTAGFPIRNRIMTTITYPEIPEKCVSDPFCKLSLQDFMGPEIDIGFRIGKYTFPGIIVVSLELAYTLLDSQLKKVKENERLRVVDTGWEELKGVWEGNKYPILWLDLPKVYELKNDKKPDDVDEVVYTPYKKWEMEKDSHVSKYNEKVVASEYEDESSLDEIIDSLPSSFDVTRPYFVKEGDDLPSNHIERADFIKKVDEINRKNDEQNSLNKPELNSAALTNDIKTMRKMFISAYNKKKKK